MATMSDGQCTIEELRKLMQSRGSEARSRIDADFGGIEGLCKKLQTDPANGISGGPEELKQRQETFGRNEIPPPPSKNFFRLVWDALKVFVRLIQFSTA